MERLELHDLIECVSGRGNRSSRWRGPILDDWDPPGRPLLDPEGQQAAPAALRAGRRESQAVRHVSQPKSVSPGLSSALSATVYCLLATALVRNNRPRSTQDHLDYGDSANAAPGRRKEFLMATVDIDLGAYKLGWHDVEENEFKPEKGLNEEIIRQMSEMKGEPQWMLDNRLKAYQRFLRKPIPQWGGGGALNDIDFDDIYYYIKPSGGQSKDWDMVPEWIKATYEKLGIPQAERKYLAGVTAQYECLRGDVRVYTVDRGMVAIKEIEPGDRVFSLNERTGQLEVHKVKSAAQTDVRQTYRVEVDGGRVVYATDNHPILTREVGSRSEISSPGPRWRWPWPFPMPVSRICAGAAQGHSRGLPREDFAQAGLAVRLRHRRRQPRPRWVAAVTWWPTGTPPRFSRARLVRSLRVTAKVGGGRVRIDHKPMIRWLQRNGLVGERDVRRVPAWVFGLPLTERAAFLRGLLDGSREGGLTGPLSGDVAELAELTGITGAESRVGFAPVISVTEADVAPVFDIEVDGPHNFVAEGVVVHNSEVVYHRNREDLEELGVLFCDMDTALREYPDLVKEYFGTIIPPTTTSSPPSTRRSGRAEALSMSRRGSMSTSRCRPTSGSTPRTWANSSGR